MWQAKAASDMTAVRWRNPLTSLRTPEWVLAMYALLVNFLWEMLQTPFFADMPQMAHWPATLLCLRATTGDAGIAVAAHLAVAARWRDRGWFLAPDRPKVALLIALGVLATVLLELHAVHWAARWSYSGLMPVIPLLGVGLVPIVQWIVLPPLTLFLLRRHHLGVPADVRD